MLAVMLGIKDPFLTHLTLTLSLQSPLQTEQCKNTVMPLKQKVGCTKITPAELCNWLENPFTKSTLNKSNSNAAGGCFSGREGEGWERRGGRGEVGRGGKRQEREGWEVSNQGP